jgi:aerobic carbon-monoxide dehydrogenase medium subunit
VKPANFKCHRPRSLEEAVHILAEVSARDGRIIAGGQSLVPTMAFRMAMPPDLVDINHVEGLDLLAYDGGWLRIGARIRHYQLGNIQGATGRVLSRVLPNIAHAPIRTRGTFCGSLAHADPASEWCTVAAGLDAIIVANSIRGQRFIPVAEYFQGVMTTDLAPDEILSEVRLAALPQSCRIGFHEFSRRRGDFALAMCLVCLEIEAGRVSAARFVIGGAAAFPCRLSSVEDWLCGRAAVEETWTEAAQLAADKIDPLPDASIPLDYRRDLVRSVACCALQQAADDQGCVA